LVQNKRKESKKNKSITTYSHPESIISEQYRMIYANLKFMISELNSKTFLITSPGDGEGKSTIAVNLAVSISQQKKKVLLIDANLRKPVLHSFFNCSNSTGLSDVLTGKITLAEAVHHTEIWRFDLLSSGRVPMNPVELLGSQMMHDLIKKAKQIYDVVLLDSNSVLEVTDTKLLANICDGVILVIKNGKTKLEKASESRKVLEFAKARLVGAILNQ
jgi:capsular exopolysaccharide synthesis family protein